MAEKNSPNTRLANCMIIDAQFKEKIGETSYSNGVLIKLQEVETGEGFVMFLSEEELRQRIKFLPGKERPLTGREMIEFAKELSNKDTPILTHVPIIGKKITSDMIEANEDLEQENDIELEHPITEKTIDRSKWAYKPKRK